MTLCDLGIGYIRPQSDHDLGLGHVQWQLCWLPCAASMCSRSSCSSFSLSRHCLISFSSLSIWFTAYLLKLSRSRWRFPARAASYVFMWTTCSIMQELLNFKYIHPGFETKGRHYQKSKIEVSVTNQKGLIFSKIKKQTFSNLFWFFRTQGWQIYFCVLVLSFVV